MTSPNTLVTFDLDGVLMQNPFRRGVFPHVCRALAPYIIHDSDCSQQDAEKKVLRLIVDEAKARLHKGLFVEAYDWDGIIAKVAKDLADRAGCNDAPDFDIAALVRHYCTQPDMIWRLPSAYESLSALAELGYTTAVVTNGFRKYQLPVLEALGLADFFSFILTPEAAGYAKPSPEIFQAAWEGKMPIHVGDDLVHDAWGARNAGGYSVWLHRDVPENLLCEAPEDRPKHSEFPLLQDQAFKNTMASEAFGVSARDCVPDALIQDLSELPQLVERVSASSQPCNM